MSANADNKSKVLPLPVKLATGAVAGAFGTSCIFPIDMVIYSTEGGFRGFYRGLLPNLTGVLPEKAIKLAANEYFREYFQKDDGSIEFLHELLSGAGAGFCQVIATNPMEITKIRMQMQATLPAEERQTTSQVVKSLGIRGMYTGTLATLSRDVPFSIVFFPLYANLKVAFADKKGDNSVASLLAAGGLAGASAAGAVTPSDVIKTRLQVAGGKERYGNMGNALKTIVKEEGFGALYNGAIPRMVVVGPLFAITLLSFEAMKYYMISQGLM